MYAKVFNQIFDSSIAKDYHTRHVFMDLLTMADHDGVVDMTVDAISRRTNIPIEKVKVAIEILSEPDLESRSKEHEGRRLIPIDSGRLWGWKIVNYDHYRNINDSEKRKKIKKVVSAPKPPLLDERLTWFDQEFWVTGVVWQKIGTGNAKEAWMKHITTRADANKAIAAARQQGPGIIQHAIINGHSVLHPATWINQGRWRDDPYASFPLIQDKKSEFQQKIQERIINATKEI